MHRFERRLRILKAKRSGVFDPDQYYLERAFRARAARKCRSMLRRMRPVVLITPRWSEAQSFLDDLSIDLSIGEPSVRARTLSMTPLRGRSVHEARNWIVRAFAELCEVGDSGPIAQAVERQGFFRHMSELLDGATGGPLRALLVHQVEHLPVEARDELVQVFEAHMERVGSKRRVNLLLAGSVDAPSFEVSGSVRVVLPDFSRAEAMEDLVEHAGPRDRDALRRTVDLVGGVPTLLRTLASGAGERRATSQTLEELWKTLGALADEVRGAISIVNSDEALAERFEHVARSGPVPREARDLPLLRAGVLHEIYGGLSAKVMVRAPMFVELAAMG